MRAISVDANTEVEGRFKDAKDIQRMQRDWKSAGNLKRISNLETLGAGGRWRRLPSR